jgi:hypothetical protein
VATERKNDVSYFITCFWAEFVQLNGESSPLQCKGEITRIIIFGGAVFRNMTPCNVVACVPKCSSSGLKSKKYKGPVE